MLILSRKESEQICLGDNIVLTIVRIANDKVRIGVVAPPEVKVLRSELEIDLSVASPTIAAPNLVGPAVPQPTLAKLTSDVKPVLKPANKKDVKSKAPVLKVRRPDEPQSEQRRAA